MNCARDVVPDPLIMAGVCGLIARAEGSALHARVLREQPYLLQSVVRARLELGAQIRAIDYVQALRLRAELTHTFVRDVLSQVDVIVTPVIPEPAPTFEAAKTGTIDEIIERVGQFSRLTRPWNGLGFPALSIPCGVSRLDLPLALQIIGRPFDEATVLRVGYAYEQVAGWWRRSPALSCISPDFV
jgi:aspartyl-tRNA(Asn)/glutamyl-tRNA(Gln) amidotransferase subunit A